jgi:hypothetical protein
MDANVDDEMACCRSYIGLVNVTSGGGSQGLKENNISYTDFVYVYIR